MSWWAWPFYLAGLSPTAFFPCGPLVAAIVVVGVTEGGRGYRAWGARLLRWRVGWVWYVVAIAVPLLIHVVTISVNLAAGAPAPDLSQFTSWYSLPLAIAVMCSVPPATGDHSAGSRGGRTVTATSTAG